MKTLRLFLPALIAAVAILTSATAEANFADACDIRSVWLPAGDEGIIKTPEVVKSDPGRYVLVVEVFSTDKEPNLLRSRFWYVCQPGVRLDPAWAAQINLHLGLAELGVLGRTHIVLAEHAAVALRGGVYWCDNNVESCLKTAIAHRPEAFVASASKGP